jgi:hypothetical protein
MSSLTSFLFAFVGAHPGELDALCAKGTNNTSPESKPTSKDQIRKDGVDVKESEDRGASTTTLAMSVKSTEPLLPKNSGKGESGTKR